MYRHHRPVPIVKVEPVPLPPWKFKCGHPVEPWNILQTGRDGSKCRECFNTYQRVYHARMRRAG